MLKNGFAIGFFDPSSLVFSHFAFPPFFLLLPFSPGKLLVCRWESKSIQFIFGIPVEVIYGDYLPGVTLQTAHEFSGGTRRGPDDAKTGASQLEAEIKLSCLEDHPC